MPPCAICSRTPTELVGVLCTRCSRQLSGPTRRAPGIVTSRIASEGADAWLVDAWGQLHAINKRCTLGRERDANDLAIADLAVSAQHAELRHEGGRWTIRDRGSVNGIGLGGQPRARTVTAAHRDHVWFGAIAFYLWAHAEPPARDVAPPDVRTLVPDRPEFHLSSDGYELVVRPVRGHPVETAPGELELHSHDAKVRRATLPRLQYQLLRALCEAAVNGDATTSVSSHELLTSLPFQTDQPAPNHVRQVVKTLRVALDRAGVPGGGAVGPDGVIHACDGTGYRVTWQVRRTSSAPR